MGIIDVVILAQEFANPRSPLPAGMLKAGLAIGRPDDSPIGACSPVPSRPVVEMPGRLQVTY